MLDRWKRLFSRKSRREAKVSSKTEAATVNSSEPDKDNLQKITSTTPPEDQKAQSPSRKGKGPAVEEPAIENLHYGLKELVPLPSDKEDAVDIVAIHGLNGHREKTWTDENTGVNWLGHKSFLRKSIPNARVLSFGYNSKTYFSRGDGDVRDFASKLLAALRSYRRSPAEQQRSIVFLCHSLGGLVFKQAIVRAHEQDAFFGALLKKIQGVVFFGTPHRGSKLAFWDSLSTRLVEAATIGYTTNSKLSRDLKVDSEMLQRISNSFVYRGADFKIRSFYELEFMPGLNCRVVERDSATLGWSNELDIASSAHHGSICKFPTAHDARYLTVISELRDIIGLQDVPVKPTFSSSEADCMAHLNCDHEYHLGQIDDPVPGSCEWVLSHKTWQQWHSWTGSSLLWITSNAGCGKSTIAKFLIQHFHIERKAGKNQEPGYFFFMDGVQGQNTASVAISALLHQLFLTQPRLIKHAMRKMTNSSNRALESFTSLWSIIVDILDDEEAKDILWVIDGLDECENQSLRGLMKALSSLFERHVTSERRYQRPSLKVILLSRPSSLIQQVLGLPANTRTAELGIRHKARLTGENESKAIAGDILRFAQFKVDTLVTTCQFPLSSVEYLQQKLVNGADFTFLWISLIVKVIEDVMIDGISITRLERVLSTTKLDDIYQYFLEKALNKNHEKARKVFSIILAAVRPITVEEMSVAVEVRDEQTKDNEAAEPQQDLPQDKIVFKSNSQLTSILEAKPGTPKAELSPLEALKKQIKVPFDNHLRQLCAHFVRIREGRLYFVHQTARSFLTDKDFVFNLDHQSARLLRDFGPRPDNQAFVETERAAWEPLVWQRIQLSQANQVILQVCMSYIKMFEKEQRPKELRAWSELEVKEYLESCKNDPPRAFFSYAAKYWVRHYRGARKAIGAKYDDYLVPQTPLFNAWAILHPAWWQESNAALGATWLDGKKVEQLADPSVLTHPLVTQVNRKVGELKAQVKRLEDDVAHHGTLSPTRGALYGVGIDNLLSDIRLGIPQIEDTSSRNFLTNELKDIVPKLFQAYEYVEESEESRNFLASTLSGDPLYFKVLTYADYLMSQEFQDKQLGEALTHFGLLDLSEAGLEEDELVNRYWTVKSDISDPEYQSDADQNSLDANDFEAPNWIKHYIRGKREEALGVGSILGSPGMNFPGLSNPGSRSYVDKDGYCTMGPLRIKDGEKIMGRSFS